MAERLIGIAGIAGIALVDAGRCPMTMTGRSDYALDANRGGGTASYQKLGGEVLVLRVLVSIAEATAALSLVETPELGGMTTGFLWRIADLIGLMAAVVTAATMLVLHFVILERLDALGAAVSAAAAAPQDAARFQVRAAGSAKLGALNGNVDRLLRATLAAFNAAQHREEELLQLADSLE